VTKINLIFSFTPLDHNNLQLHAKKYLKYIIYQ